MQSKFQGFEERKKRFGALPDQFFSDLLPVIDDINELKVTIYLLWAAYKLGDFGSAFTIKDLLLDDIFCEGLQGEKKSKQELVEQALQLAAVRGSLIQVEGSRADETVYFINSPRGRAAAEFVPERTVIGARY